MKSILSIVFISFVTILMAENPSNKFSEFNIDNLKSNADFIVNCRSSFLQATLLAKPYNIIYIKGNISIDLSDVKKIQIIEGIKIIGDRDIKKGIRGAILYTNTPGTHPLFEIIGDNVIIRGITIKGDDGEVLVGENAFKDKSKEYIKKNYIKLYNQNMYASPVSSGIATDKLNTIIDNCELFNWTYTAVYVKKGAKKVLIKNSYIHHNQRFGLGYGITVDQGEAIIKNNIFNYNRHSIASTGRKGSKYVVLNNLFLKDGNNSWAIDMHGGKDRNDGTNLAGEYVIVKYNTFYLTGNGQAFVIRGRSEKKSIVEDNIVFRDNNSSIIYEKVFEQVNSKGNLDIKNNDIR